MKVHINCIKYVNIVYRKSMQHTYVTRGANCYFSFVRRALMSTSSNSNKNPPLLKNRTRKINLCLP